MESLNLKPLDKFLLFTVRYGLYSALFLPFVVVLSYLYPWVSGKIWGFEIIVELLFPLYVWLAFRRKEYRPAGNAFTYAVLAWFAVATLAMLFGDNVHRSMWSKPDRLTGMFFQYHLLAFFLMAGSVWRGRLRGPITVTVCVVAVSALHALLQYFGSGSTGERGSATFGNASYFGQYIVPHVFLAAWLMWQDRRSPRAAVWGVFIVLYLASIVFASQSRGAILGLFITALTGAIVAAVKGSGALKKAARISLVGLALVVVGFFAADKWSPTHAWLYDHRLSVQYFQETRGSRQLLIENVIKGIKDRPLLGWGPENFESSFYFHFNPVTLNYSDYETRQDRPHNFVLELLVNFGIIGLLAYASILFFGWRGALRSGEDKWTEGSILALGTVAQVATNLFIFETPMSYVMMAFQLSFLAAFLTPQAEAGEDEMSEGATPAFITAAVLCLWAMWFGVIGTIKAAGHTAAAIISLQGSQPQMPAEDFQKLLDELESVKTPYLERDLRAITSHLGLGRNEYRSDSYVPVLRHLAKWSADRADKHKNDFVFNLVNSSALASLWPREPAEQQALEARIERVKALAPNRQEVRWLEAQIEEEKGNLVRARDLLREAVDLDPNIVLPQAHYAGFLVRNGEVDEAMAFMKDRWEKIRQLPDANFLISKGIVKLLESGRNEQLIGLYEAAERNGIKSFEWLMSGALGYINTGNLEKGRAIAEEAKVLFPEKAELIDRNLGPILNATK